jgi:DNA-binding transcriptional LysR family regulator
MIPSPTDLSYFLAVAESQNLSRAAERLGISQPSLTLAMRRIEEAVGTNLLIRHKRGVTLTKAGKQLLTHTRHIMQHWDSIKSETLASVTEVQGSFTIGCHPSVALCLLPKFLADLLDKNPRLDINLKHDSMSRRITEQVINMSIDIAIVVNPVRHADLIIKKLTDDKISLWQGRTDREIQNLQSGRALLICDPDLLQTQDILKKLKKKGMNFARVLPTNNLELIADLTASGCGIGILPGNIAMPRKLVRIPGAPFFEDEICLLYHGENRDVKALQVIVAAIKAAF